MKQQDDSELLEQFFDYIAPDRDSLIEGDDGVVRGVFLDAEDDPFSFEFVDVDVIQINVEQETYIQLSADDLLGLYWKIMERDELTKKLKTPLPKG